MTFWIRHITLLLLCVVVPFGAALYVDTLSEIDRAQEAGGTAAKLSERSLGQSLRLDAHRTVGTALTAAGKAADADLIDDLASRNKRRRETAAQAAEEILSKVAPKGGFAWLLDQDGTIVWRNGMTEPEESPRSIAGHPLFLKTQLGYALDGFWVEEGLSLVGAAPLSPDGRAAGAVMIGRPVNADLLAQLSETLGIEISVASGNEVIASTLDDAFAKEVVAATKKSVDPVHGGRLDQPLRSESIPMLPIMIDPHAEGLAYTSVAHSAPSGRVRWVVSVPSAEPLQQLAQRQEIILGVLAASLMLALLVGLVNYRTFVSPIERVADHLSNIQIGRGEVEMPEGRVSRPFRRLVRLINMTVQKMPTRGFPSSSSLSDASPISERQSTGDLRPKAAEPLQAEALGQAPPPPPPAEAPPPMDISSFPEAPAQQDPIAEAMASMSPPLPDPSQDLQPADADEDSASAIAEAIASLEQQQQAAADIGLSAPPQPKSASDIRGGVPQMESPFTPSQSEYFRAGSHTSGLPSEMGESYMPQAVDEEAQGPVRGGGSLDQHAGLGSAAPVHNNNFTPESTVVAPVQEDLLAKSAREDVTGEHGAVEEAKPDATVVASVPADLLAQSAGEAPPESPKQSDPHGLDAADHAHFKQVYERFIAMRRKCGEATADLAFDRFLSKLTKNRENLIKKYNCRTVRFQVYEKDGKAALKATPVRAR